MVKHFYVYILANARNGALYIGMTGNIHRRMEEHKKHLVEGFSSKYDVTKLVYVEQHDTFISAATREKRMKTWQRKWKLRIIEELNPEWKDLSENGDIIFD